MLSAFLPKNLGDTSNGGTALIDFGTYSRLLIFTEKQFELGTDGVIIVQRLDHPDLNIWVRAAAYALPDGTIPSSWQILQYANIGMRLFLYFK